MVRELAREAGLVPTAFYRHFESVDDLASELAAHLGADHLPLGDITAEGLTDTVRARTARPGHPRTEGEVA